MCQSEAGKKKILVNPPGEDFPAWTAVGIKELVMPQLLVEIRATAVIGSSKAG